MTRTQGTGDKVSGQIAGERRRLRDCVGIVTSPYLVAELSNKLNKYSFAGIEKYYHYYVKTSGVLLLFQDMRANMGASVPH